MSRAPLWLDVASAERSIRSALSLKPALRHRAPLVPRTCSPPRVGWRNRCTRATAALELDPMNLLMTVQSRVAPHNGPRAVACGRGRRRSVAMDPRYHGATTSWRGSGVARGALRALEAVAGGRPAAAGKPGDALGFSGAPSRSRGTLRRRGQTAKGHLGWPRGRRKVRPNEVALIHLGLASERRPGVARPGRTRRSAGMAYLEVIRGSTHSVGAAVPGAGPRDGHPWPEAAPLTKSRPPPPPFSGLSVPRVVLRLGVDDLERSSPAPGMRAALVAIRAAASRVPRASEERYIGPRW
jgi:hypothetical protein